MIRALKIALIVFGVVGILFGLLLIFSPSTLASKSGVSEVAGYLKYTMATLGYTLIAPSVFLTFAARDPLRHINWVRFAIVWCILGLAVELYSVARSDVTFGHAAALIIMHAFFAVVFLALYPWRRKISG
jgi:hypothetical protein